MTTIHRKATTLPPQISFNGRIRIPLSKVAFWVAIGLPVLYLPLFLSGIETLTELFLFIGLLGIHVLALIRGSGYRRPIE